MGRILSYKHGEGSVKNVDPRLWDIVQNAVAAIPYDAEIRSGAEQRSTRGNNHNHGWAVDVTLIDPQTGKKLPDYQDGKAFAAYEQYAQTARVYQQQKYPELNNTFRWGGYFGSKSGPFGYGAGDLMHLDINPNMNGAMSQGSWENGASKSLLEAYPGAVSNGGLGGAEGGRRVAQYRTALAGSGGLTPPGIIPGPAPMPAGMSDRIRTARLGADDTGIGTAFSQLERFGQPGAAPVSMSDALAYSSGRVRDDIPLPRSRPVGPVADVAMPRARPTPPTRQAPIGPIGTTGTPGYPPATSPLESARAKLTAARQNGLTGSPIANVATPNIDMARLSAETGRDIGRDGVVFDRTYDSDNRMSTGGFGALLDSRSFSPSTPNPAPRSSAPIGPIGMRGTPGYPPPVPQQSQPRSGVLSDEYTAPRRAPSPAPAHQRPGSGSLPTHMERTSAKSIGPIGITGTPGYSPTNAPSPFQRTAGTQTGSTFQPPVAGTVQMPRDARPSAVPKYIPKTVMVAVKNDPSAIPAGTKLNFGSRDSVAQRAAGEAAAQKFVPKTIMVLNPEYKAPTPAVQSPALTVSRSNSALAPTPANQSAALRAQRSPSSSSSKPSTTTVRKSASPYSSSDPRSQMVSKGTGQTGLHLGIGGW